MRCVPWSEYGPPMPSTPYMGGNDFGVNDASSWDGGSSDGGGDWS